MAEPTSFTLSFLGDVMLGRLVDQLFPQHVNNADDQENATHFAKTYPKLLSRDNFHHSSPWGTTLPLLRTSDLTLINLETSVTTNSEPWPHKAFNYRMHPANLAPVLHAAHIDYASLANNHTLDFGTDGLVETIWTMKQAGIAFAGAGESTNEAHKPAALWLPRQTQEFHARRVDGRKLLPSREQRNHSTSHDPPTHHGPAHLIHVYAASDHPREWSTVPTFHLLDYSPAARTQLRKTLLSGGAQDGSGSSASSSSSSAAAARPALKIFSVHWGPNYAWQPAARIHALAHFVIDECGVDVVHGHSSHHVQGVEVYRGKVIIYGCGDFVDDYCLHEDYRNDLGAVWRVVVTEGEVGGALGLRLERVEIFPTRVDRFRAMLLSGKDRDHRWVRRKIAALSGELGTRVREALGDEGQIVIDI
ncbi:uncharacterized protein N7459_002993 [Penicillium hispanicum]|uniref:uncharacterized protein n=1 Tax=Penicillium hispanicum TaxID=1080232 RepID=UPI002541E7C0|nr:uncharacterized protein N7459_002993 [Penicillium hispanicum]KAJ5587228.1 hypothetical protein N7459_002993 [Penicillium hispanicum]